MAITELLCRVCEKKMNLDFFPVRYRSGNYKNHTPICKVCDLARANAWKSSSPRNFLSGRYTEAKARGRRGNIPVSKDFTLELLVSMYKEQKGKCAVSGLPMTWEIEVFKKANADNRRGTNISIDRINSSKGYEPKNIRLVCEKVNQIKSSMNDVDLYFWSAQIASSMSSKD